jgi:1,4-alpha-glucan branching enzyme
MGWMNDMLRYMSKDPIHRQYHHNDITFSMLYAFHENFVLPFSHDEVVHGKGSMIGKMPGDDWQKFANLRLLYGFMYGHPGKKLLFMGNEIGQWAEWNHESSIEWHLLQYGPHEGLRQWVRDLNRFYRSEPAAHEVDFEHQGFEWIDCNDSAASIISFLRWSKARKPVLFVCNFTPVLRRHYRVGAPRGGFWEEVLNSDAECYGGSGQGNLGGVNAYSESCHGRPCSLDLTVPPLGVVAFRPVG